MYDSRSALNETKSFKARPRENSFFMRPNSPVVQALSRQFPLLDMLWAKPASARRYIATWRRPFLSQPSASPCCASSTWTPHFSGSCFLSLRIGARFNLVHLVHAETFAKCTCPSWARGGGVAVGRLYRPNVPVPLGRWETAVGAYASALAVTVKVVLAGMLLALSQKAPLLSA